MDCPICRRGEPLDVLLDIGPAWVTAGADAPLPGYVCVVAKQHVIEPFDLDLDDGHAFWDALMTVARRLRAATKARKINYEIHGNTLPHLHVHLYPRFEGDPFEGRPIEGATSNFRREPGDLAALKAAIEVERSRLDRWLPC
jgi:diadenosine tetraphosphate (Ap4A) HIT family hydrolase